MRRTQIYLDEEDAAELASRAKARGVTSSHVIREAIAAYLAGPDDDAAELRRQRAALEEAFGTIPRLPDGATYVADVRRDDRARSEDLEERWRSR